MAVFALSFLMLVMQNCPGGIEETQVVVHFLPSVMNSPYTPIYVILLLKIQQTFTYLKKIFFRFLGLHPQHMEVPRLGVKSEL